ncbi:MAG: cysteine desulfurase [Lachnospiraceae bacterium]|nr:cysteine desulfurase [Lachnospiraceae bacterium]
MEIYFDNAATTVVYPEVRELCMTLMAEDFGNPSSMHIKGVDAEEYVKASALQMARALKCRDKELVFTSGGTESNNMAIIGSALAKRRKGKHIITTAIEHASVSSPLSFLEKEGYEVTRIPCGSDGRVNVEDVAAAVREDTILVTIMLVNNEVGSVQPVKEIAKAVKAIREDIYVHTDAVQAFGKIRTDVRELNVDLLSISGHKLHGPKGSGALFVKEGTLLRPIIYGGGQQRDMRSGTENVPAIAGMGLAAEKMTNALDENTNKMLAVKNTLSEGFSRLDGVTLHSGDAPHIVSASFTGVRSEVMLHSLEDKGIYVSAGSACSTNKPHVSETLKSMGLSKEELDSTIRFSFSELNTEEEARYTVDTVSELLPMLRRFKR